MAFILTKEDTLWKSNLKEWAAFGVKQKDESYIFPDDYKFNLESLKRKSLLEKRSGECSTKYQEIGYYHHACPMCYNYEVLVDKIYLEDILPKFRERNNGRIFPIKSAYCTRCNWEWVV